MARADGDCGGTTVTTTTALDEIDFWDLDLFVDGDPHQAWTTLRREAPVWWHDRPGGEPFWSVVRYRDARTIHGQPLLFSSQRAGIVVRDRRRSPPPRAPARPRGSTP